MPQIYASNTAHMLRTFLLSCAIAAAPWIHAQRLEATHPMGGTAAVQQLIEQELQYPVAALEAKIKGDVTVVVGVNADGTVQGMKVWKSVCPECDEEALRLVRLINWHPSTATEERGSADHYIQVTFDPAKYKRWVKGRTERKSPVFDLPMHDTLAVFAPRQLETQVTPLVPRGHAGLGKYLADNMRYPEEAYRRSIEGVVVLQFVVEPSGSLSNMVAVEDLGGGCTAEAMRLVYRTPWAPGVRNGRRVRSSTEVSIRFNLPQVR
jgi:TonB family protein